MFTQCPHCHTFFRINREQLDLAAGRVRCCQCQQVFNALDQLLDNPLAREHSAEPAQIRDKAVEQLATTTQQPDGLTTDTLNLDSEQLYDITQIEEELADSELSLFLEQDNGLESEPDYFASSSESQMSALLDSDSSQLGAYTEASSSADMGLVSAQQQTEASDTDRMAASITDPDSKTKAAIAESLPENSEPPDTPVSTPLSSFTEKLKQEAAPANQNASASDYSIDEMFEKASAGYGTILWGFASLMLIFTLGLQLAWHYREHVIEQEIGRQLLTQMCNIAGCSVPLRRDTSKILIEHRDLRAHPDKSNALLLQLDMVNRATFDQPYPSLHLSLFNDDEKLIADRTFEPEEYMQSALTRDSLMHRFQSVQINLELVDPGKDVTGFKFDFL